MVTMNISLPEKMKDWVDSRSEDGKFSNNSDYMRHLIRQDQERQAAIARLNAALEEAERSEVVEDFDFEAFLAQKRAEFSKKAS